MAFYHTQSEVRLAVTRFLEFTANFRFLRAASASTRGRIDVEKLITSCSGLLCRAARALKGAGAARDKQLQEALQ